MLVLQNKNSQSIPYDGNKRQITFVQNPGKLIYCNYPEALRANDVLGDKQYGNHYLNSAVVKKDDDCQLVASHSNRTSLNMKYGVQFYNGSQSIVNLKVSNIGFRALPPAGWDISSLEVWNDFFQGAVELHSIPPKESIWFFKEDVLPNYYLNAIMRFEADGDLECYEYVYLDLNNIDGNTQLYPWDKESPVYRGTGSSYYITADIELKISELPCLIFTNTNDCNNNNEMIAIVEPSDNSVYSKENGANLGNWGIQYEFNVTIINDTNTQKNVIAYVGADQSQHPDNPDQPRALSVINLGGNIGTCVSEANYSWNWAKEDSPIFSAQTIDPPYKYQYIHANNSCGPSVHMWRLDGDS